ncbi:hypothetical protein ACTWQB_03870 [Piscibacillus sp. B03]|uniref:hypothetical protein n=1 Tax=Piscibacillus sp. B03 TaxID=3457430 RepID=UPI003FCEE5A2
MSWNVINNEHDAKHLLESFDYFHDSCLKELYMWTGSYVSEDLGMTVPTELDTNIRVLFQGQGKPISAVELVFKGVTQLQLTPTPRNYDSIILDAAVNYQHNQVCYEDSLGNIIKSNTLKWRDVSRWMGPTLRLGELDE